MTVPNRKKQTTYDMQPEDCIYTVGLGLSDGGYSVDTPLMEREELVDFLGNIIEELEDENG